MALENTDHNLSDYMGMLRRRWRLTLSVMMIIAFGTIFVAYSLPAVYESSATILIEQQGIPTDFVQTTISTYAEQLLQTIYQRVLAAPKVAEIIQKFDLYAQERGLVPDDELYLLFRDSTEMSPKNVATVNSRTGREAIITYGFVIAFQHPDPVKARDVAEELANLFVSHNTQLRTETAARTSAFLDVETSQLEAQLAEIAERIAIFKEGHPNNLPDDQGVNFRTWERLREEMTEVDSQRRLTQETKALLEAELADTPRFRPVLDGSGEPILGGIDQLAAAQQELIRLRGKYSEDHPSIINLRREIASLSSSPVNRANLAEQIRTDLNDRRQVLSATRQVYSDTHPDVVRLQLNVRSLQQQLAEVEAEIASLGPGATARPNNPVYVQTRTRIDAAEAELANLGRRHRELTSRVIDLERLRVAAPQVEREYTALTQEQGVLLTQYRDLRMLEGEAAMGEALETGQSGERLTIIEPARIPSTPVSPNRASLSFLGIVLAIAIGLGVASLTDAMDTTVRGRSDLYQLLGAPPIGIIPYVESTTDIVKRISVNIAMSAAMIGAITVVINLVLT